MRRLKPTRFIPEVATERRWNLICSLLVLASCLSWGCATPDYTDSGVGCVYDCLDEPDWVADEQCKLHGECGVW